MEAQIFNEQTATEHAEGISYLSYLLMTTHDQMHVVFTHSAAIQERLTGFLQCMRKTCIHVVEPAFDLHLLASDELPWRTLHCAVLKYLTQKTSQQLK